MPQPRALVIEDNIDNAEMFSDALMLVGYNTAIAHTGLEALNWLEMNRAPQLVLLDVNIPDVDGRTVYKSMRQKPKYADTLVLVTTANSVMAKVMATELIGDDLILQKPFPILDLQAKAKQLKTKLNL